MASYNRVVLVGNLTRDPELRYIPSGTAVTDIGLAMNEKYKNGKGEWVEEVTFVDVTMWGRTAEVACEYLSKGSSALIEGRLKLDQWEKDGKKNSRLRVVCDRMQMLGSKGDGSGKRGGGRGGESGGGPPAYDESEASFGGGPSGPSYDDSGSGAPNRQSVGHGAPTPGDDIPF